jgi:two-component system OmpR family sensor kinase
VSLRARLLIVIAIVLVTYAVTAILVVGNQRSLLIAQVDRRLAALPPPMQVSGSTSVPANGQAGAPNAPDAPAPPPSDSYSDIYVAWIHRDGSVEPLVVGSLLTDAPDLADVVEPGQVGPVMRTISGDNPTDKYRALVQPAPNGQGNTVTALPLQEVDDAVSRLERTLALAGIVIAVVLAALYFWIQRLGLAPISRLAGTAEAVAAGDRDRRAVDTDRYTEAGKLGLAFNLMLDERDLAESRLRQFIADASHELRTPLTSMRGYLDLYRQGAFRQEGQLDDVVRRMSSETARMTDLVKDLLALASLDEGRPLRLEPTDLGRIVHDAAQDAQAVQPTRPIAADAPETGPTICADEALIVQLLSILVSNALYYTPVDAAVVLRASTDSKGALIVISDTGPGLEPDAAHHAFDRFWRGESSRLRGAAGGSGLGLSIAKSIVDAHHGSIALDTAPGHGATFTIHFPTAMDRCPPADTIARET